MSDVGGPSNILRLGPDPERIRPDTGRGRHSLRMWKPPSTLIRSPVLNGKGELIGLAFDGNIEAMAGDVIFDDNLQRTINVDIRYVMWLVEKLSGANNIIEELTIKK